MPHQFLQVIFKCESVCSGNLFALVHVTDIEYILTDADYVISEFTNEKEHGHRNKIKNTTCQTRSYHKY